MGKYDLQNSQLIWNLFFSEKELVPILFFTRVAFCEIHPHLGYKFYFLFVIRENVCLLPHKNVFGSNSALTLQMQLVSNLLLRGVICNINAIIY